MKRTAKISEFKAIELPEDPLQFVKFASLESPIKATVKYGDETHKVVITRTDNPKEAEIQCTCDADGVCIHAALALAAIKQARTLAEQEPPLVPEEDPVGLEIKPEAPQAPPEPKPVSKAAPKKDANKGPFKPASKAEAKLRMAIFGPAGSGKTMSALRIATGLGGPIAVIDTERGSAAKYADRFKFDTVQLTDYSLESFLDMIENAADAGYPVLVIDSITHEWDELKDYVTKVSKSPRHHGNTWSAWSEGTPRHKKFIEAILSYPGHVIATIRSKTEWITETSKGKTRPVRVGLTPEQGKGIEYEFDLLAEINADHVASIIKDRTGKYQDKVIDRPGEDFGKALAAWLNE